MLDRPPERAAPRWLIYAVRAAMVAWVVIVAITTYAVASRDPLPPSPLPGVLIGALVTATVTLVIGQCTYLIIARLERFGPIAGEVRTVVWASAAVADAPTCEMPCIVERPGLDPEVLDIGRRIARRLRSPES